MQDGRILVIDKERGFITYLRHVLDSEGYSVDGVTSSMEGIDKVKTDNYNLVMVKYGMTDMKSMELIGDLKKLLPEITVIVLFDKSSIIKTANFSKYGIYSYLVKPVNLEKLHLVLNKGIQLNKILLSQGKLMQGLEEENTSLRKQNILLAKRIEESTKNLTRLYDDLRQTYMRTIKALAQAIDTRDHYTGSHSANVTKYAVAIAREMHLSTKEIEIIRESCELHDLGKVGIQDYILSKPTKLTHEEWEQMKKHPMKGAQILEHLTFLGDVVELVREHHEHYDGKGYPLGHRAEEIPLGARIICLADSYDAMTSARSYRKVPLSKKEAVAEIVKNSGKQFDPKIVEVFLKVAEKF